MAAAAQQLAAVRLSGADQAEEGPDEAGRPCCLRSVALELKAVMGHNLTLAETHGFALCDFFLLNEGTKSNF